MSQHKKSQKKGKEVERLALLHLRKNNFFGLIQQRATVVRNGRVIYTEPQGCDIVGNHCYGQALYVEVKSNEKNHLNFGPNGHVKSHQRDFLIARHKEGCLAIIAWYYKENFYFISIHKILGWMQTNKKTSYPIGEAIKNNMLP